MRSGLRRCLLLTSTCLLGAATALWPVPIPAQTAPLDPEPAAEIEFIDAIGDTEPADQELDAEEPDMRPIETLKGKAPPLPDLAGIVKNRAWAQAAGKALFWDQQIGSDTVACASCHFRAGADPRITNQLNPGFNAGDTVFGNGSTTGATASGQVAGPNLTLRPGDFPFRKLRNINDAGSEVLFDTNDVAGSAGTFAGEFVVSREHPKQRATNTDRCRTVTDPVFSIAGHGVRKVAPRNSPSVINAVFNHRNFWDGRANNLFSGVGVFGRRDFRNDPAARLLVLTPDGGTALKIVRLNDASAASQAVGPLLSDIEMSCTSRVFADIGRKMMAQRALTLQAVHVSDSLFGQAGPLGDIISTSRIGLKHTYAEMIRRGFAKRFWGDPNRYRFVDNADGSVSLVRDPAGYTQMELNFPLFFGLSIMLYEATLISDDSPFDRGQLTAQQKRGKEIFEGKGKCIACHDGPLFSKAAHAAAPGKQPKLVERMAMGDGGTSLYDNGFYNIGVRPDSDDLGVGGTDPYRIPLSFSRQWSLGRKVDAFLVEPCTFDVPFPGQPAAGCGGKAIPQGIRLRDERLAVDGAFKTPTLRNVALTPPYFHNGGQATLQDVVAFYNRGGDFSSPNKAPDIRPLGLSAAEQSALVTFLLSLTDERVRCARAPFDHPELLIPDGHKAETVKSDGRLADRLRTLSATGALGYSPDRCPANTGNLFDMARNINGLPIRQ